METDWQIKAAERTLEQLSSLGITPENTSSEGPYGTTVSHLYQMINTMKEPMSAAKRGRWLGWMQGVCCSVLPSYIDLGDCKEINKLSSEEFEKEKSLLIIKNQIEEKLEELRNLCADIYKHDAQFSFDCNTHHTISTVEGDVIDIVGPVIKVNIWKDI